MRLVPDVCPEIGEWWRWFSPLERTRHIARLCEESARIFRTATTQEWLERLSAADIPCMRVHTAETLLKDPHLAAVDYFERVEHPSEREVFQMRSATTTDE